MTPVNIRDLEQAINLARQRLPASGAESRLSDEVSQMAEIYGLLIYRGHTVFDMQSLDEPVRRTVELWLRQARDAGTRAA
ncbi:MAG: DUF3717 domain-containing protein [Burkholderiaceae bacterium]